MVPVVPGSHPWASRTGAHQGLEMCTLVQYQTKASGLLCAALSMRVCVCVCVCVDLVSLYYTEHRQAQPIRL